VSAKPDWLVYLAMVPYFLTLPLGSCVFMALAERYARLTGSYSRRLRVPVWLVHLGLPIFCLLQAFWTNVDKAGGVEQNRFWVEVAFVSWVLTGPLLVGTVWLGLQIWQRLRDRPERDQV
jgi:hypothetical protein